MNKTTSLDKKTNSTAKPTGAQAAGGAARADVSHAHGNSTWVRTLRETMESIVIAFILAFLFRTFEAEAFVIPTGSMAPTLQGRHKDVFCPKCNYQYRVSASEEVDTDSGEQRAALDNVMCPMCSYTLDVNPRNKNNAVEYPSYNGDRIIVSKFAYDVSDPERWDVVVFKYPEDAKINYIKRLVGLPNERLHIEHGDIYTSPLNEQKWQIARKPPAKLQAMLQPVYDNDYVVPQLIAAGMPPRWQPWQAEGTAGGWQTSEDYKSFSLEPAGSDRQWLRYQHLVPSYHDWERVEEGQSITGARPQKITDFYAYNEGRVYNQQVMGAEDRFVGDLALDVTVDLANDRGAVVLELVKGGVAFRARIDAATGTATLASSALPDFAPTAQTPVRGPGKFELSFSNVDDELLLWVDGKLVEFDGPTTYPRLDNWEPKELDPVKGSETPTDLSPVGIAFEGGAGGAVSSLRIRRDIFYLANPGSHIEGPATPINLKEDQYFMLGDNSPRSKDSRYWDAEKYVDRKLLIGKALFIYWPHSWWPDWAWKVKVMGNDVHVPFWPNFKRMGFVR